MALYRPLSEISLNDIAEFGGKAARLGEALRLGCSVLPGIVLSAELYRRFMRQGGLQGEIRSILATMQPQTLGQFQAAEWAIRSAFEVRRIPDDVVATIHDAWHALGAERAAVRSSATNEDSPHQSFVGQHAYSLDVTGPEAAVQAVLNCWASLYSAQALSYAHSFGVDLLSSAMAVLLQPMVEPSARGALFTVDPVTGNPDVFLLSVQEGPRAGVHTLDPYGRSPGEEPSWAHLRDMALLLDEHEAAYQSLDWVLVDDQVYLLRARPVTGVPRYLPREAIEREPHPAPLLWVHPPEVTPRAARPLSVYHQSRAHDLHVAYHARQREIARGHTAPHLCFFCGYLYTAPAAQESDSPYTVGFVLRVLRNLKLLLQARALDEEYRTRRAREQPRLAALCAQDLTRPDNAGLATILGEAMALHKQFAAEAGLLERADRALADLVVRVARRWNVDDLLDPDLLLATAVPQNDASGTELPNSAHALAGRAAARALGEHVLAAWLDLVDVAHAEVKQQDIRPTGSRIPAGAASQEMRAQWQQIWERMAARLNRLQSSAYRWLIEQARGYRILAEDSHATLALCRVLESEAVREVGRRMTAAGLLSSERQAGLFACRELLDWLQGRLAAEEITRLARERADTARRHARYAPPERIEPGQDPGPQPERPHDQRFAGRAVCAGRVSGRARVLRSLSEANQLLPGEILVCQELPFELTPLFSVAAAVVTEGGDLLDHASVLAREYGVPTVFGVAEATRRIQTGDSLLVDANHGVVLRRAPEPDWEMWAI